MSIAPRNNFFLFFFQRLYYFCNRFFIEILLSIYRIRLTYARPDLYEYLVEGDTACAYRIQHLAYVSCLNLRMYLKLKKAKNEVRNLFFFFPGRLQQFDTLNEQFQRPQRLIYLPFGQF